MKYFLIILTLTIAILGVKFVQIKPKYDKIILLVTVVLLVASAASQIYIEHQSAKKEWREKWSGKLRSPIRSRENNPVLRLGDSRMAWAGEPNKPILQVAEEPLTISLKDGKAEVSLVIRDNNGIILAGIRNNEWFVAQPPVTLDRNFNENSLEVINAKGEVIFQVQIVGEEVRLAGHFYTINGQGPSGIGPWLGKAPSGKLFKYPSAEHPGELADE